LRAVPGAAALFARKELLGTERLRFPHGTQIAAIVLEAGPRVLATAAPSRSVSQGAREIEGDSTVKEGRSE